MINQVFIGIYRFPPLAKGGRGDLSAPNLDLTHDLDKKPTLTSFSKGE